MIRHRANYVVIEEHRTLSERIMAILHLAVDLTKAELRSKQFQRLLGPVWWIIEPTMMSLVFYFLTTQLNYAAYSGVDSFMYIFVGITTWRYFSRCIENSLFAYVSYGPVIRQTSFPLLSANLALIFTEFIMFCCALGMILAFGLYSSTVKIGWTYTLLPLLIFCQSLFTLGLSVLFATIGVYIRDLSAPLAIGINVIFFLSPGAYNVTLPDGLRFLEVLNPFFYFFPAYRSILLKDTVPPIEPLFEWTIISFALFLVAVALFRVLRPNFLRVL